MSSRGTKLGKAEGYDESTRVNEAGRARHNPVTRSLRRSEKQCLLRF